MKLAKWAVNYRHARRGAKRRCGTCSMFRYSLRAGGSCTLVAGLIVRSDVCDRWAAK